MKIHLVREELFLADGQRDRHDEASSGFCNFANEPQNCTFCSRCIY